MKDLCVEKIWIYSIDRNTVNALYKTILKSHHSGWPLSQLWWAEHSPESPDGNQPLSEDAGICPPGLT